ncbi:MAG: YajG family lipoprotein [Candidatus Binataceae bacterium]
MPPPSIAVPRASSGASLIRICAFAIVALAGLVAGCSSVYPSRVELEYSPSQFYNPVEGAEGVAVRVNVRDLRTEKIDVGQTLDSVGQVSSYITVKNDVDYILKKSMEKALAMRGFNVTPNAQVAVNLELSQLYSTFQPNWHSGTAHATLVMNAQVVARDGAVTFYQTVSGDGGRNDQDPTGDNRAAGLDQALNRAVNNLSDRKDFHRAILYADRLRPLPVPVPSPGAIPRSSSISPAH